MEEKKKFRVERTTATPNPKYIRGSFAASTRNAEVYSKTFNFFDTLEDARAFAKANGGFVQELSKSGSSYRMVRW